MDVLQAHDDRHDENGAVDETRSERARRDLGAQVGDDVARQQADDVPGNDDREGDQHLRNKDQDARKHGRQVADTQHRQRVGNCQHNDQPEQYRANDADQLGRDQGLLGRCQTGRALIEKTEQGAGRDAGETRDDDARDQDRYCDDFVPSNNVTQHSGSSIGV